MYVCRYVEKISSEKVGNSFDGMPPVTEGACSELGFSDAAHLDEGNMWPTAFALKELTAAEEARIGALVKKAVS